MRVVVDLNVVVSGLLDRGKTGFPFRVLRLVESGAIEIVVCRRWLDEVEEVTGRRRFAAVSEGRAAFLAALERIATIAPDPGVIPTATRDPDDDYLVALALATRSEAIVSGDGDLHAYGGPPKIITPRELVERMELRGPRGI